MNTLWQPLLPPRDVKATWDEFESWGAVVDHFLFSAPSAVDVSTHQLAAQSGLSAVVEKWRYRGWATLEADVSKLTSQRAESLTPAQFFGRYFDFESRKPLFDFPGAFFPHAYDDEENAHRRRKEVNSFDDGNEWARGYTYALLDPPYNLSRRTPWLHKKHPLLPLERGTAFLRLCDALFGDLESLEIYFWPTDCSNYFDAGLEWWGSSFWTVYAPSKNWLVTILASSTD